MPTHTYDFPEDFPIPAPGDVLRPARLSTSRAWYIIEELRPVESRVNPNRWKIRVRRFDPDQVVTIEQTARIITYELNR